MELQKKLSELFKFDKIIVQLLSFYFPAIPTYGPASPDGNNRDTNGLEGSWYPFQKNMHYERKRRNNLEIESVKACIQKDTYDVSSMHTRPVAVSAEWANIFCYSEQSTKLPGPYHFMTVYKTSSGQHLKTKAEVQRNLGDLTFYLPTKYHLKKLALPEAILNRSVEQNPLF